MSEMKPAAFAEMNEWEREARERCSGNSYGELSHRLLRVIACARQLLDTNGEIAHRFANELDAMEVQRDAAEAALAACEDTKRLDWLERMAHDSDNIGDIDIGGSWVTQVVEVGDSAITGIRGEGATVREAIDRARAPLP